MNKSLLVCLLCVICGVAQAAELYRYKNEQGVLVTTDRMPPAAAAAGYEVVSESGRILRVVAPLSKGGVGEQASREADAEQQRNDAYLLTSFSKVEEIEAQADRKLTQVRFDIRQLEGTLNTLITNENLLIDRAANLEMADQKIPANLLADLEQNRTAQREMQERLLLREEERLELRARYDGLISRFRQLKGINEGP